MSPVIPAAAALLVAVCSSHCALTGLLTGQGNRGGLLLLCQLMQIHIHPGHARQLPPAFLIPACTYGMSAQPCLNWLRMKYLQVYMHAGGAGQGKAEWSRAGAGQEQGKVGQGGDGQGRVRQDRAGWSRAGAGQGRARQSRAGEGRGGAGRGRAGQGRAGQGRAGQGRLGQGRADWSRAGQTAAGQGRFGQGRAASTAYPGQSMYGAMMG